MARTKIQKNQKIDVTIKPWWQTQLFAALVAGSIGLLPYGCDRMIERKIAQDNVGHTFLYSTNELRFAFNKSNPNALDFELHGGTFEKHDSWIELSNYGENIERFARGVHDGEFSGVVRGLRCHTRYNFRTSAQFNGRVVSGVVAQLDTPRCTSKEERSSVSKSPGFVQSL
jgi:hypothetical protein